jgi:hypothetical protein
VAFALPMAPDPGEWRNIFEVKVDQFLW